MRIFVTGGSGLLGSKLAEVALERGHQVFSGYSHNLPEKGLPINFDLARSGL
ncbi:MAG: NAD-dependent epimerase/dehydratase family protein [Methanotrichaceae archaeon]|nr:NAD-dependent epimerase/dehydratase family protein [Methanotrichaceae archaeon]